MQVWPEEGFPREPKKFTNQKYKQKETQYLDSDAVDDDSEPLFTVEEKSHPPILIKLKFNGRDTEMELDTGAAMSIISSKTQQSFRCHLTYIHL